MGKLSVIGFPVELSRMETGNYRFAPLHGENTEEILKTYGFLEEGIAQLRDKKIIM